MCSAPATADVANPPQAGAKRLRVLHVITGLNTGGAEVALWKLLGHTRDRFQHEVVSLQPEGDLAEPIRGMGINVHSLGMRRTLPNPVAAVRALRIARHFRPDIIQGWMYHGNLVAALAARGPKERPALLWNIRQTIDDLSTERRTTALAIRMGALLSRSPERIIYNSLVSPGQHEALGYRAEKRAVIPNGFDCVEFRPDEQARREVREELGVAADTELVGLVARYHPVKDHAGFLEAAGRVARQHPTVRFVLIGAGVTAEQPELKRMLERHELSGRVFLLGMRTDMPRLTAALDVACSASAWGEGFSNAIGEAMACGIPCVVTSTGDSASLVGETGLVVPSRDPEALASTVLRLLAGAEERHRLGQAARARIETEFSMPTMAGRYEELYRSLVPQTSTI